MLRASSSSHCEAKTKMTGEESAENHCLLLKMGFNIEGNNKQERMFMLYSVGHTYTYILYLTLT